MRKVHRSEMGFKYVVFSFNRPKTDFKVFWNYVGFSAVISESFFTPKWDVTFRHWLLYLTTSSPFIIQYISLSFSFFHSLTEEDRSHFISPKQVTHIYYFRLHTRTHKHTDNGYSTNMKVRKRVWVGVRTSTFNGFTDVCFRSGHHRTSYSPPLDVI